MPIWRLVLTLMLISFGGISNAQTDAGLQLRSAVLVIDFERLFAESDFGLDVGREFSTHGSQLAAENRKIESELIAEEKTIADLRPSIVQIEFRKMADAFDAKVQSIRATQERKAAEISQESDSARAHFIEIVRPVLEEIIMETGAAVILERGAVFLSINAVDITDEAIQRINANTHPDTTATDE